MSKPMRVARTKTERLSRVAVAIALIGCVVTAGCGRNDDDAKAAKLESVPTDRPPVVDEQLDEQPPLPPFDIAPLSRERGVTIELGDVAIQLDDAVVTRGGRGGQVIVDEDTGQYLWAAHACQNESCPHRESASHPLIFVHPAPILGIDDEGYAKVRKGFDLDRLTPKCPVCRRIDTVRPYMLPESARRQDELDRELAAARSEFRATGALPTGMRPPAEIFRERSQLRRLYLPKKYRRGVH